MNYSIQRWDYHSVFGLPNLSLSSNSLLCLLNLTKNSSFMKSIPNLILILVNFSYLVDNDFPDLIDSFFPLQQKIIPGFFLSFPYPLGSNGLFSRLPHLLAKKTLNNSKDIA